MKYFILMADIIASREKDQNELMIDFKNIVNKINNTFREQLLSPLTITLGDEFQCVIKDLSSSTEIIIAIEELIFKNNLTFKLRYILNQGIIETKINPSIAYEMLGSGLTDARIALNKSKNQKIKFIVKIDDLKKSEILNNAFLIFENITSKWDAQKDYKIVSNFIKFMDYKRVALDMNRTKSIMWKREKTLNIQAYFSTKKIIQIISTD